MRVAGRRGASAPCERFATCSLGPRCPRSRPLLPVQKSRRGNSAGLGILGATSLGPHTAVEHSPSNRRARHAASHASVLISFGTKIDAFSHQRSPRASQFFVGHARLARSTSPSTSKSTSSWATAYAAVCHRVLRHCALQHPVRTHPAHAPCRRLPRSRRNQGAQDRAPLSARDWIPGHPTIDHRVQFWHGLRTPCGRAERNLLY